MSIVHNEKVSAIPRELPRNVEDGVAVHSGQAEVDDFDLPVREQPIEPLPEE